MQVFPMPEATNTFLPERRGCGPESEGSWETWNESSGRRVPENGLSLSPAWVPGAFREGNPSPKASCAPPSALPASPPRCVTPAGPCPSLGCAGQTRGQRLGRGNEILPLLGGSQPWFPQSGSSFKPRLGAVIASWLRPGSQLGPGNPPGARKGQLRLVEAASDVRASPTPPPPEARGGGLSRGGAQGPGGFGVSP